MGGFFEISYLLLLGAVLIEVLVLREALSETVKLKGRLYTRFDRDDALLPGTRAPRFSASLLGSKRTLRTSDLRGHATILFFVSPREATTPLYKNLGMVLHAHMHKKEGHVYLVCAGTKQACSLFRSTYAKQFPEDKILLDVSGSIVRSFRIATTPRAVELDENGNIARYGHPEIAETASEEQGNQNNRDVETAGTTPRDWPANRSISGAAFA